MFEDIFNFSAAGGPPPRKGDAARNPKGLLEGMKVGLKARDVKAGRPNSMSTAPLTEGTAAQQESVPSVVKNDIKTGLKAWYAKRGELVNETTSAINVGAELPARALGDRQEWRGGAPSQRRASPMAKGGSSLRSHIQALEKSLEGTLATLSNKKQFSENDGIEFRSMLIDALADYLSTGSNDKLKELKMQATLVESSKFIGEPAPETAEVLTDVNDLGKRFTEKMGFSSGPIVEMVTTHLSSGAPLDVVRSNVAAALRMTVDSRTRTTLSKAARVLAEM